MNENIFSNLTKIDVILTYAIKGVIKLVLYPLKCPKDERDNDGDIVGRPVVSRMSS